MPKSKLTVGVELRCVSSLEDAVMSALDDKIDFIIAPLVHPRLKRDLIGVSDSRHEPMTRTDLVLDSTYWSSHVVGRVSSWLSLDSPSPRVRAASEAALLQELRWASHLSLSATLLPEPTADCFNYAQQLNQLLQSTSAAMQLWVRLSASPLCGHEGVAASTGGGSGGDGDEEAKEGDSSACVLPAGKAARRKDSWEVWAMLFALCESHGSLGVCLELTAELPDKRQLARWFGEPLRAVLLPTSIFTTNRKGFPILPRAHRAFVQALFDRKVEFIVTGRSHYSTGYTPYLQYVAHLHGQQADATLQEAFEMPYYDFLQAPLQPLMDNLESQTYETFEKDPVKYARYEDAITAALTDRPLGERTVVMVVGAGRGPLVRAALQASIRAERDIKVFAVEKNPNAVITLRNLVAMEWGDAVTVVSCDMRLWDAPEQAHILVSELLGSFGDNELSPECLDGAQRFLRPDGISIPYEYTSFLAPVTTSKLWTEVAGMKALKHFETPYVVRMHAAHEVAPAKPAFTFHHPNWEEHIDNSRFISLSWKVEEGATLHGMAGYFEAKLYGDIMISINPATFSDGMFSWFPLYLPILTPVHVAAGSTIEALLWRKVGPKQVWYEWAFASPTVTAIHNPSGRSYAIGL